MIPENKKTAVSKALQATFGVSEFEDIREMNAGLSTALVFRIMVKGKPYLLRVITRTDAMSDPTHWYGCMNSAAEAGIAPHVWYADTEDRVSITDFIDAKPFPIEDAKVKLPVLLSKLHSLPPFPFRINYIDMIGQFILKFQAEKLLPDEMTREIFDLYNKIKSIYPWHESDLVACHNDLKPENMLYDGERVWLVDWEAAFLNDRYIDLAIAANFLVGNDADEKDYLQHYFGKEVTEYQYARFFLARQLLHISYFVVFILMGKTTGKPVDPNVPKPGFGDFHDRIWAGDISLADMNNRVRYALVHMEQLRLNLGLDRLERSMDIVANYKSA